MTKDVPVKAVKTTFEIIEGLVDLDGAGVKELAEYIDIPESTVHDHLRTLQDERYILNRNGNYRISARFLDLGGQSRKKIPVYQTAADELHRLAIETGEHILLLTEERGLGVILALYEGNQAVDIDSHPGLHVRLHTTAMGKCLLAHMRAEWVDTIVDKYGLPAVTPQTTTEFNQLESELEEIREQGYGIDSSGEIEGIKCIAAPIFQNGDVVASVGLCGPVNRINGNYAKEMRDELLQSVNVTQVALNYS
jgi:IclR family acetate operon transcriptional repressor